MYPKSNLEYVLKRLPRDFADLRSFIEHYDRCSYLDKLRIVAAIDRQKSGFKDTEAVLQYVDHLVLVYGQDTIEKTLCLRSGALDSSGWVVHNDWDERYWSTFYSLYLNYEESDDDDN